MVSGSSLIFGKYRHIDRLPECPQDLVRPLDLLRANQVNRCLWNEYQHEEEWNVERRQHDGQPLPVEQRAQALAGQHAQRPGDGGNHGQPRPHGRSGNLHDVQSADGG